MANLIAMTVARNARATGQMRLNGVSEYPRQLVAYASTEIHECVIKAMEILGIGARYLRKIPTDDQFRMDLQALRDSIVDDRNSGLEPFCIVGTAGTVNTGAIDDLDGLANLSTAEKIWFHVDGAFGGLCVLSEALRPRLKGIDRADSIAFDFHKWMHVPYDAGCVLVRHGDLHRSAFSTRPPISANYHEGWLAVPTGLAISGLNYHAGFAL